MASARLPAWAETRVPWPGRDGGSQGQPRWGLRKRWFVCAPMWCGVAETCAGSWIEGVTPRESRCAGARSGGRWARRALQPGELVVREGACAFSAEAGYCRNEARRRPVGPGAGRRAGSPPRSSAPSASLRQERQDGAVGDADGDGGADDHAGEAIHVCYLKCVVGVTQGNSVHEWHLTLFWQPHVACARQHRCRCCDALPLATASPAFSRSSPRRARPTTPASRTWTAGHAWRTGQDAPRRPCGARVPRLPQRG